MSDILPSFISSNVVNLENRGFVSYVHAQDGGTASNIKDDLVLEEVAVVVDRIAVRLGANFIFLHIKQVVSKPSP